VGSLPRLLECLQERVGGPGGELLGAAQDEDAGLPLVRRERRAREDQRAHLVDREVLRLRRASPDLLGRVEAALEHDHVRVHGPALPLADGDPHARRALAARRDPVGLAHLAHERLRQA